MARPAPESCVVRQVLWHRALGTAVDLLSTFSKEFLTEPHHLSSRKIKGNGGAGPQPGPLLPLQGTPPDRPGVELCIHRTLVPVLPTGDSLSFTYPDRGIPIMNPYHDRNCPFMIGESWYHSTTGVARLCGSQHCTQSCYTQDTAPDYTP